MRAVHGVMPMALALLLGGCGGADDVADLKAYADEVRAKPKGAVEPLPHFPHYHAFTYDAGALRSPFEPQATVDPANRRKGSLENMPDPNRLKQFLEGFNLDQLEMVGTLSNRTGTFALIRGAGGVHRVKVGDYLGRNDGRIVAISDSQVEIVEIVSDGMGAWLERPRTISLKERS